MFTITADNDGIYSALKCTKTEAGPIFLNGMPTNVHVSPDEGEPFDCEQGDVAPHAALLSRW